tara:strand:- start:2316 stop:2471 length:156 start_codon:yes stop_codon:yes gene_type:complete
MSSIPRLEQAIREVKKASMFEKGRKAEAVLDMALEIVSDHEKRLLELERKI